MIDENGDSLGVKPIEVARKLADTAGFDLVCVAPNAKTPVCRFLDYSKFRYEQQRKARESKKNQKNISLKEIWLSPVISQNDFDTKLRNGRKFLNDGNKLKVTLRFNRRMRMLSSDVDIEAMLNKYIEGTADIADVESRPVLEGRSMSLTLSPKKEKK